MHRCKSRGFCCEQPHGARMWMEERIGKRINTERIEEALALSPDTISTACPYCLVMLGDAVSAKKSSGEAKETLEVVDVAQLLARSVSPAGAGDTSGVSVGDAEAGAATGENAETGPAAVTPESMGGYPTADGRSGAQTGTSRGEDGREAPDS